MACRDPRITKFFSVALGGADLSTWQKAPVLELIFFIVSPSFPISNRKQYLNQIYINCDDENNNKYCEWDEGDCCSILTFKCRKELLF